jgi:hypothetical protein
MGLIGNGEGMSLLILTDAESRLLRSVLDEVEACGDNRGIKVFNAGIARGTAKIQQEFKDTQARKKGAKT